MTGQELLSSLASLAALSPPSGSVEREVQLLVEVAETRLADLGPPQILRLLEALHRLRCLPPRSLQAGLEQMPSAVHLPTEELIALLAFLRSVAEDSSQTAPCPHQSLTNCFDGLRAAVLDARAALRGRLRTLGGATLLRVLALSSDLELALGVPATASRDGQKVGPALVALLAKQSAERINFSSGTGEGFHKLLLGELTAGGSPQSATLAVASLSASDCAELSRVLAQLARSEARSRSLAGLGGPRATIAGPPPYLAKLVPPLVERLLLQLELMRPEELVVSLEALSLGLGYRSDYLADRFGEALKLRLVPVSCSPQSGLGNESNDGSQLLRRGLRALAWQGLVPFSELLGAALEDVAQRVESGLKLGIPPEEGLCTSLGADRAFAAAVAARQSAISEAAEHAKGKRRKPTRGSALQQEDAAWLEAIRCQFEGAHLEPTDRGPAAVSAVPWPLDAPSLREMRSNWCRVRDWHQGTAEMLSSETQTAESS
ncbi:unnamed protein product [Polarella glacialis]|uniref:Uncharacterized protein n=1 Tax=Polarella glacialis TaxID=89957 RepID=A0A813H8U2_POLGL|nr:unnamed protein product [Polarella glacialis]